jgi:hypothetical protein
MTVRYYLDNLSPVAHFSLLKTIVHVGKPLQYQALLTSPLSTIMTTGTNLPIPPILTIKSLETK